MAGAGLSLGAALGIAGTAQADIDVVTVNSTLDPGDGDCATGGCTLREAITVTDDADADADQILFQSGLSGTITLSAGQLPAIDEPLQILGPGAGTLTVSANDLNRILAINTGTATGTGDDVTVSGLTLLDGNGGTAGGGAISNAFGDLTLQDATLSSNRSTTGEGGALKAFQAETTIEESTISGNSTSGDVARGGALYSFQSPITIQGSTISGNSTGGFTARGGALYSHMSTTTIQESTISGNSTTNSDAISYGYGGALFSSGGTTTIEASTISGNTTSGLSGRGGGLAALGSMTTIESSTISGNTTSGAFANGGGLSVYQGTTTMENSTISGNSTGGSSAPGGGLYSALGMTSIQSSTISDNSTGANGGGLHSNNNNVDPVLANAIVANNSAAGVGPELSSPNDIFQVSFSLIENPTSAPFNTTVPGSNLTGVDPQLQMLASNGGPTMTRALAPTSPVVDCGLSPFTTDQRGMGFPRPVDHPRANSTAAGADGSDMGAFELEGSAAAGACTNLAPPTLPPVTPVTPVTPGPVTAPQKKKKKKCKKKKRKGRAAAAKRCRKRK